MHLTKNPAKNKKDGLAKALRANLLRRKAANTTVKDQPNKQKEQINNKPEIKE